MVCGICQRVPTIFSNRSSSVVHSLTVLSIHKNLGQIVAAGLHLRHHYATVHLYSRFLGHAPDSGLVFLVLLISVLHKVVATSHRAGVGSRGILCQIVREIYKLAMYIIVSETVVSNTAHMDHFLISILEDFKYSKTRRL